MVSTVCSAITGVTFPSAFVSYSGGQAVLTSSNGDTIRMTVSGTSVNNLNCTALNTFDLKLATTGGTGRFTQATGTLTLVGTQVQTTASCPAGNVPKGDMEFTWGGTIENVAR